MILRKPEAGKSFAGNTTLRREEQSKIGTQRHLLFLFERMVSRHNITMANTNTEIDQRWKCDVMDTEWIPKLMHGQDKTETEEKVVAENCINKVKRLWDKFETRDGGSGSIHFIQGLLGNSQPKTICASINKIQTLRFGPTLVGNFFCQDLLKVAFGSSVIQRCSPENLFLAQDNTGSGDTSERKQPTLTDEYDDILLFMHSS